MLGPAACKAHIVPALDNCSLLLLGQLCDAGYNILLESNTISVLDAGEGWPYLLAAETILLACGTSHYPAPALRT
jgi:hypothetical protein